MIVREIRVDDAKEFTQLVKEVEASSDFMLMGPGERKTTLEQQRKQFNKVNLMIGELTMKSKILDLIMYILLIVFSTYLLISQDSPAVYLGIYAVCVAFFLGYKNQETQRK